jgi:predicted transcriptional regulator of viral defense system
MDKGNYLTTLLRSQKTVFSLKDLALLWHETSTNATSVRLNYYVNKGELYRIRKGLYAKDKNYDRYELATRILTPAYVSFETILVKEGVIFQFYEPIFVASYTTRKILVDQQYYYFRKIKNEVLLNGLGIKHENETSFATKERAFLDTLYLNNHYYFDNLQALNWGLIFEILPIYENKQLAKKVNLLHHQVESELHDDQYNPS